MPICGRTSPIDFVDSCMHMSSIVFTTSACLLRSDRKRSYFGSKWLLEYLQALLRVKKNNELQTQLDLNDVIGKLIWKVS